jgi:hypothetical protein
MFAGVPCILRKGINFGFQYPYMNKETGYFADENDLPDVIIRMLNKHQRFRPREWVMANMTCQEATKILNNSLGEVAMKRGERWTEPMVPKVNHLHGMDYWNPEDRLRFEADYAYLRSKIRTVSNQNRWVGQVV